MRVTLRRESAMSMNAPSSEGRAESVFITLISKPFPQLLCSNYPYPYSTTEYLVTYPAKRWITRTFSAKLSHSVAPELTS
ncbi:uncharacterized protein LY79DRAFT_20766 [Colletotrichum navitas]|uniref:Uncharacterized protein n=1 Tax=Colletotrichum navitas TaxID=681940 RepID=A0AAD8QE33_9PEZI|nr:uncharacterized protein LY79DRAFT_20766 [Colletotrichum navitas]KAK1600474.1 hypothetical protein LY79DRAFT_20766 [Colletotrichum navitas]